MCSRRHDLAASPRDGAPAREVALAEPQRHVHESDQRGHLDQRPNDRRERGAVADPNVATATAMASSKLFEAAVNERVAGRAGRQVGAQAGECPLERSVSTGVGSGSRA